MGLANGVHLCMNCSTDFTFNPLAMMPPMMSRMEKEAMDRIMPPMLGPYSSCVECDIGQCTEGEDQFEEDNDASMRQEVPDLTLLTAMLNTLMSNKQCVRCTMKPGCGPSPSILPSIIIIDLDNVK